MSNLERQHLPWKSWCGCKAYLNPKPPFTHRGPLRKPGGSNFEPHLVCNSHLQNISIPKLYSLLDLSRTDKGTDLMLFCFLPTCGNESVTAVIAKYKISDWSSQSPNLALIIIPLAFHTCKSALKEATKENLSCSPTRCSLSIVTMMQFSGANKLQKA